MNENFLSNVNVSHLREAFKESDQVGIDNDFCIVNMKFRRRERTLNFPFRFDGILLVWCIKGRLSVSINLNDYILKENTLFLCVPGNIFKLNEIISDEEELHYVCIAMSREFAADQKVDVNKTFSNGLSLMDDPSVALSEEESAMIADYIDMMGKVARSELTYKKESIQSLWTSMIYIFAGVLDNRAKAKDPAESTNRSRLLFEQFISLVAKYHGQYRNVGFYADKLCLTPKYLSKLIKNATGRSAPEWIDAYVILEAKNMLKYSNETIKEIVYKLNLPNQSVFYKFFKARTGMTTSEYRNS